MKDRRVGVGVLLVEKWGTFRVTKVSVVLWYIYYMYNACHDSNKRDKIRI